jgi:hypothetical protein
MDCYVAFDPELQIDISDFIAAWNNTADSRELAEARAVSQPPQGFPLDPELIQQGLTFLTGAATVIVGGALKDLLKDKLKEILQKRFKKPAPKVEWIRQPDGAYLMVVSKVEK